MTVLAFSAVFAYSVVTVVWAWTNPPTRRRSDDPPVLQVDDYLLPEAT